MTNSRFKQNTSWEILKLCHSNGSFACITRVSLIKYVYFLSHTYEPPSVDSDEAGSTKEAKACTKRAIVLFLEGFSY